MPVTYTCETCERERGRHESQPYDTMREARDAAEAHAEAHRAADRAASDYEARVELSKILQAGWGII